MSFKPYHWLILLIEENESEVDIAIRLNDVWLHPDIWNEEERWIKWNVAGYSEKAIEVFVGKIKKELLSIGKIKYEFIYE
jgi:hypothetical protein